MKITLYLEISLYSGDSVHVNVPLRKLGEAGNETSRERVKTPTVAPFTYCVGAFSSLSPCLHCQPANPISRIQTFRPQSLKKPLATLDSRKVTVRDFRVMSVTVISPGHMTGLQIFSDVVPSSGPVELQPSVLSCPG